VSAARAALGLGTVQFGLRYGLAAAPTSVASVRRILECAREHGVAVLDTAPVYGESERVLGDALPSGHGFRVVTKTRPGAVDPLEDLRESLRRLRLEAVAGLLVHAADDLLGPRGEALWAALCEARAAGLALKIGVSVYHPRQAEAILARYPVELVQAPFNALDQRLRTSGVLDRLRARGVEVHARSVFLQGVLLVEPEKLPSRLERLRAPVERFRRAARELSLSPLAAALACVRGTAGIDVTLVGVETPRQLDEVLAASVEGVDPAAFAAIALDDEGVLDPSRWDAAEPDPRTGRFAADEDRVSALLEDG
jgi:aryl-alcohol dehydrogenase-like predicted oxidoreductase